MENLPLYIAFTFGITVLLTVWLFSKATHYSKPFMFFVIVLMIIQSLLGLSDFYNDINTMNARFPLLVLPLMTFFTSLFIFRDGRIFIDSLDIKTLTLLHSIRIPVEIVLFWLYQHHTIPLEMTFEGRNFDILSGLTAPLIYYFGFIKKQLSRKLMISWNVVCILLLVNVVANALLSLPVRFKNFGFDEANTAVGFFPFLLLPAIVVPLVLFSNIFTIRQLLVNKNSGLNN
jgi:hypothetical protein